MRPSQILLATAAIAGTPVAAMLVLVASGEARLAPVLAVVGATVAVAVALALVWARDLDLLAEIVRHAASGQPHPRAAPYPALAPVEDLMREIERLARATAARSAFAERISRADEAIVERLPDPLIVLDASRVVRRANAAARAAYGGDLQAVLRHPGLRGALDRGFEAARAMQAEPSGDARSAATETAELTVPVPVQRDVRATVIVLARPLADGGEVLVVLSDRTRERAIERTRADFVANASHELRTPLASLVGFIETIRGPAADDPPAQLRFLGIMAEQADRMARLIDDLLSLSRIELTEHQPPADSVDLAAMLPRIAEGFEPRAAQRAMTLSLELAPSLPLVVADLNQMMQVFQNLIDNAFKYGRDGGWVRVLAEPASGETGGPHARWPARPGVVVTVADDGMGIPREHLPRLTERFYRVDKGRARGVGGTGLGLAIVKHILNRHRGQLLIESEEGQGTRIAVWLPRSTATQATAALPASRPPVTAMRDVRQSSVKSAPKPAEKAPRPSVKPAAAKPTSGTPNAA